jgi:hypothetical protein
LANTESIPKNSVRVLVGLKGERIQRLQSAIVGCHRLSVVDGEDSRRQYKQGESKTAAVLMEGDASSVSRARDAIRQFFAAFESADEKNCQAFLEQLIRDPSTKYHPKQDTDAISSSRAVTVDLNPRVNRDPRTTVGRKRLRDAADDGQISQRQKTDTHQQKAINSGESEATSKPTPTEAVARQNPLDNVLSEEPRQQVHAFAKRYRTEWLTWIQDQKIAHIGNDPKRYSLSVCRRFKREVEARGNGGRNADRKDGQRQAAEARKAQPCKFWAGCINPRCSFAHPRGRSDAPVRSLLAVASPRTL